MQTIFDDAFESWKALYSDDIEHIWMTERKELRQAAMVFHVLKQEFARVEFNLNCEMDNFKQKVELMDIQKKSELSPKREPSEVKQPPQLQRNNSEESNKSPKINKHRKTSHLKKLPTSPSLLEIQKEKNLDQLQPHFRTAEQDIPNFSVCSSPSKGDVHDSKCIKANVFKTPQNRKPRENVDVVDSSFVVQETPNISTAKKLKRNKKSSKEKLSKSSSSKGKKDFTLTQMFDYLPNQIINITNDKRNTKQVFGAQNNVEQTVSDDETFFALTEEQMETDDIQISEQKENISVPKAFLKDYDKIPEVKSISPQYVHKTETVRRKADRMKLPGWSCTDCKQYYKGLNLPPEELHKKMNACSKHRNKFPLLDQTFQGYWDVVMPATQESQ